MPSCAGPVTVVIATRDRWSTLDRCLRELGRLDPAPPVIVVDNASRDDTPARVRAAHPGVRVVALPGNFAAAARTVGARLARTRWVAFCDDDSWWGRGALEAATAVLDADPLAALAAARVLVGPDGRLDPTSALMAAGPFDAWGGRSPEGRRSVTGFLACAAVVDRHRFLAAGGFDVHLGIGGEEELLTLDLAAVGWRLLYAPEAVVHHHPSPSRDPGHRRRLLARNSVLVAAQRMATSTVAGRCLAAASGVARRELPPAVVGDTAALLPWAVRHRRRVDRAVLRRALASNGAAPAAGDPAPFAGARAG